MWFLRSIFFPTLSSFHVNIHIYQFSLFSNLTYMYTIYSHASSSRNDNRQLQMLVFNLQAHICSDLSLVSLSLSLSLSLSPV
ncbi:hypothetical protein LguiA_008776 [Lonicera macranthoides]